MRLGLIGSGPQGQRYLLAQNGGRHITVSGSRSVALEDVDGVIIATHPAGHKKLTLEAIAAGKPVLIEKPLALSLIDCEAIIDAAEAARVPLEVAHTHLWSRAWEPPHPVSKVNAVAVYTEHNRDYSAWIDWGPHVLALVADCRPDYSLGSLLAHAAVEQHREKRGVHANVTGVSGRKLFYSGETKEGQTPMARMVQQFINFNACLGWRHWLDRNTFNRRVYRALFAQENHGTA